MKRRLAAAAIAALAACLLVALAGCSEPYDPNASMKESSVDAAALKEAGTLHVGVDASSYPFAGQANGRMSGLEVDLAAAIGQELGLKVDFVDVGMDGVAALSGDEVDIVMGVEGEETGDACWTSDAYAPSAIAIFAMDEGAAVPKKSKDPVIAAQTSSLSAWLVTRQFGNSALQAEDDLKSVFAALQNGEVTYAASDVVVGTYVLNSEGIDAHRIALMQQPDGYCIGVAKDNDVLQDAIAQALSNVEQNGIYGIIMTKWVGGVVDVSDAQFTAAAEDEDGKDKASTLPIAQDDAA